MSRVSELSTDTWEAEVLRATVPVIVDFWAQWCAPCRVMTPTIAELADKLDAQAKVCKLNVDDHPAISERYEIRGIPTVMLFRGGEVKEQVVGVTSPEYLFQMVEKYLNRGQTNE